MQEEEDRFQYKDSVKEKQKRLQFANSPSPVRYSQDQRWGGVQYQGQHGYEGGYDREEYQQQYGYKNNHWQIIQNNCFHLNQHENEANLENNPVAEGNNIEDEFEQFLNGPFAKKYELLLLNY